LAVLALIAPASFVLPVSASIRVAAPAPPRHVLFVLVDDLGFSDLSYKRDMYIWFAKVSASMAVEAIKQRINPLNVEHYQQLVAPDWYAG
jgi:hypothetical protein